MQQNEREYLNTLKVRLTEYVSREDLDDILSDYAEHFSIGKSEGRSEEDLCRALGSPEDVAKEIRATYLVKKAEQACSAGNIWHAVMATLGLGLFNLVCRAHPLHHPHRAPCDHLRCGSIPGHCRPILLLAAVMQLLGVTISVPWWTSPPSGILISIALFITGVFMVVVDLHLARFFYRVCDTVPEMEYPGNTGGETHGQGQNPAVQNTVIRRVSVTGS